MVKIIIELKDISLVEHFKGEVIIENATYVPIVGEHISLTDEQKQKLKEEILNSSNLKKHFMKYIMHYGKKPLKKFEWKNNTPSQIRKKVRDFNIKWGLFFPPTIKLISKKVSLYENYTLIKYEAEFSELYNQKLETSTEIQCEEAIIRCIEQINSGHITLDIKKY